MTKGRILLSQFGPFFGLFLVVALFAASLAVKDIADRRTADASTWSQAAHASDYDGLKPSSA